jgi:hypothetical protein
VARERAIVGMSTAGDVGERLGKRRGLTGGVREAERVFVRKETASTGRPHRAARERERKGARVGADRRAPRARGRAR